MRIERDRLIQLLRAARDRRYRERQLEQASELGERCLVVETGERRERRGEKIGDGTQALMACSEVEGFLEGGDHPLDRVLGDEPLDVSHESLGLGRRGRGDEMPREVTAVAT